MRKEIYEQPHAVADTLLGRTRRRRPAAARRDAPVRPRTLRDVDKIIIIACGTSFYAGMVAKYAIEHWTRIPVEVELAHEFRYRDPILDQRHAGRRDQPVRRDRGHAAWRSGTPASSARRCSRSATPTARPSRASPTRVIYTHAGPEIGVASTKGFLTQIIACYLLGLYLAQVRGTRYGDEIAAGDGRARARSRPRSQTRARRVPSRSTSSPATQADSRSVLFLGRHVGYPVALEGALKLKELAYIHAEGFAAGELKHGPIALIEEGLPVFVRRAARAAATSCTTRWSATSRRSAPAAPAPSCLAEEGDDDVEPYADVLIRLPAGAGAARSRWSPSCRCRSSPASWPPQGHDVDQPRNLAKSVTVE